MAAGQFQFVAHEIDQIGARRHAAANFLAVNGEGDIDVVIHGTFRPFGGGRERRLGRQFRQHPRGEYAGQVHFHRRWSVEVFHRV